MPDVLEMPYTPKILIPSGTENSEKNSAKNSEKITQKLAGNTCLAGDIIGDYSFAQPLKPGSRVAFTDMAIYTMVKNNSFNGIPLPGIALLNENGQIEMVKEFSYEDFKRKL